MIDLSKLNEYFTPVAFQMDTLVKVKAVAEPGMCATSLDLSDAYHHISYEVRFASVPMFPGKGQALHVPRPTVRSNVRAVGIHAGSETSEAVVIKTSSHSIPISRRLVKPIPVTTTGGKVDRSISRTVPSSRPINKSREIRAGFHASDRVSRRKVRFAARTSVPHAETPSHSDATSSRGNRAAKASIPQSGVTSRAVVRDSSHQSH